VNNRDAAGARASAEAVDKGSRIAEHAHCCGGRVSSQAILAGVLGDGLLLGQAHLKAHH
jgi:hypothetical protein